MILTCKLVLVSGSDFSETLIESVRRFPSLWDKSSKEYAKRKSIKELHWAQVAEECRSDGECLCMRLQKVNGVNNISRPGHIQCCVAKLVAGSGCHLALSCANAHRWAGQESCLMFASVWPPAMTDCWTHNLPDVGLLVMLDKNQTN